MPATAFNFIPQQHNEFGSALFLKYLGALSGLELNTEKCEGLWLGNAKALQLNATLFGINLTGLSSSDA